MALRKHIESLFPLPSKKTACTQLIKQKIERQSAQKAKLPLKLPIAPKLAKLAKHTGIFQTY